MKTTTLSLPVSFFIILNLLLCVATYAKSDEPSHSNFEKDFSLTLTTEVTETYCGGCVGSIDLTVIGGQPPYTYNWVNGATTEDIDDLCIGLYGVTVSDATGCTGTTNPFLGQNNYPNVELESQAEVDEYIANYSFCAEVPGVLRIGTTFSEPPSDITDISGLSFINSVGSNLLIFQNPNLSSLDGLQNITSVGFSINITGNDGLTNLDGFPNINAINAGLTIDNCPNIESLEGLNQIVSIGGDVYLAAAHSLSNLAPLSNLQMVDGTLDIRICTNLSNFDGLENLNTINGDLIIRQNFMLNDISALDHAIAISGDLDVQDNDLSNCSIIPICQLLSAGANATISNNNTGCNSVDQVISACTSSPISISLEGTPPSCIGECDGIITISVTGGTAPFTYQLDGGVSNFPVFTGLCADEYTVTVTDADGLTISSIFELTSPDFIESNIFIIEAECYQSCGFELEFSTTGGTPPYTYSGLPDEICVDTFYELIISDANGCNQVQSFTIPFMEPPNFVLDETGDDINGQNTGYFNTTVSGGVGPFLYEWYLDGMLVSTAADPTGLSAGEYTLVLNDDGCILEYGPFTIDAITGLEDLDHQSVRVYPIPAKEYIQVAFDLPISENISFTLWDSAGALINAGAISNNDLIPIEDLGSGVYFLRMVVSGGVVMKVVVKG